MVTLMYPDPIVEEIHEIRAKIAEQFGYDLKAIVRDMQARQEKSGHIVRPAPSRPAQVVDESVQ